MDDPFERVQRLIVETERALGRSMTPTEIEGEAARSRAEAQAFADIADRRRSEAYERRRAAYRQEEEAFRARHGLKPLRPEEP